MNGKRIDRVIPGSIAEELELLPGDILVSINDNPVEDVLDYRFLCQDEYLDILIRRGSEEAVFEVEKDFDDDLGLVFDNGLMDEYHSCCNKCIFCFIDQMPEGMRETLYFKDDDERLSFLQGNYITLTNLKEHDIDRIIKYHLEPINISVHTMNPELRCKMLHNRFAGDSLKIIDRLYNAGIEMNAQIVLCEGINDGDELEYTIKKLAEYAPVIQSVSVVPVGLTKHREGLYDLKPVSVQNAEKVIDLIEKYQKIIFNKHKIHFIHASDEFYLMTGRELPAEETYDGYLQYENGVGMVRELHDSFINELKTKSGDNHEDSIIIATGSINEVHLNELILPFNKKYPNVKVNILPVVNNFFGEKITVAGLITGTDLEKQLKEYLKNNQKPNKVLISLNMLKSGETVFLDDVKLSDIAASINTDIIPVPCDGKCLLDALCGEDTTFETDYNSYEKRRNI